MHSSKYIGNVFSLAAGQLKFTRSYQGKTVAALLGSSVNFTWSFSGGSHGVQAILWGIKRDGDYGFINDGIFESIDPSGNPFPIPCIPTGYKGRVAESAGGNKFSGRVIFTLSSIKKYDEKFYGCRLSPIYGFDNDRFDAVYLFVQGE